MHTHDSVKPYVRSKGRKFEKARGRRRSNGFKVRRLIFLCRFILRVHVLECSCALRTYMSLVQYNVFFSMRADYAVRRLAFNTQRNRPSQQVHMTSRATYIPGNRLLIVNTRQTLSSLVCPTQSRQTLLTYLEWASSVCCGRDMQ